MFGWELSGSLAHTETAVYHHDGPSSNYSPSSVSLLVYLTPFICLWHRVIGPPSPNIPSKCPHCPGRRGWFALVSHFRIRPYGSRHRVMWVLYADRRTAGGRMRSTDLDIEPLRCYDNPRISSAMAVTHAAYNTWREARSPPVRLQDRPVSTAAGVGQGLGRVMRAWAKVWMTGSWYGSRCAVDSGYGSGVEGRGSAQYV
ncbi:hypothetical protein R3P38DRAFT_2758853 [Favolaschia claudopus]|uniref:Uncharacterized protein n=1 Tax=Favolaschia claudopus TaxID=2862362 RepID=A0AAW0E5Y1_9AGAR